MTKHVHAELMMQYAQDAAETDQPWERWEFKHPGGWAHMVSHPFWDECVVYRRKPKYILINGIEVPEPMREAPDDGTPVYIANLVTIEGVSEIEWSHHSAHTRRLNQGFIHSTYADAEAHANALLSFTAK